MEHMKYVHKDPNASGVPGKSRLDYQTSPIPDNNMYSKDPQHTLVLPFLTATQLTHSTITWAYEAKFFMTPNFDLPKIVESSY